MALTYDDLDVAVRKAFLPGIVNQFFKATPLLVRLMSKNNVKLRGGRKIAQPVVYDELPSGYYSGLDTFDTSYKQTHTYAEWDWKSAYVNVTIPGDDIAKAESDQEIIGILRPKMEVASLTMRKKLCEGIYSDGTGDGGKAVDGLLNALDNGDTYSTYGGIDRSTNTWWKGNVDSTGGSLTLDMIQDMYGTCMDGDEHPDLIVMPPALYNKLWARVQPQQRFLPRDSDLAQVGFEGITFNRAVIVPDNYCPSGTIFVLNTKYIQFVINTNRNFDWTPPKEPTNQDAYVRQLLVMCNLIVTAPWRSGIIKNVT